MQPATSLDEARKNVVGAFVALPEDAFEQVITLMCPAPSRPFHFDALSRIGFVLFREAVNAYFAVKASAPHGAANDL